jgi:hypothetical protein
MSRSHGLPEIPVDRETVDLPLPRIRTFVMQQRVCRVPANLAPASVNTTIRLWRSNRGNAKCVSRLLI